MVSLYINVTLFSKKGYKEGYRENIIYIFSSKWPLNWELLPEALLGFTNQISTKAGFEHNKVIEVNILRRANGRIWHLPFWFEDQEKMGKSTIFGSTVN